MRFCSRRLLVTAIGSLTLFCGGVPLAAAAPVGNLFTYQGELQKNGSDVDGRADFRFKLFDAATAGSQVGPLRTKRNTLVTEGRFSTTLDFGVNPYTTSSALWLQIEVRSPSGTGAFVVLNGRQRLTATPFSLATRGLNVGSNGNVGIGTTAPEAPLHLFYGPDGGLNDPALLINKSSCGAACAQEDFNEGLRLLNSNPNGQIGMGFLVDGAPTINSVPSAWIGTGYNGGTNLSNSLLFAVRDNPSTLTTRMFIDGTTGNTGIGTTSPQATLDVRGSAVVHGDITLATGNRLYIGDPTENTDPVYFSRTFNVPNETLTSLVLGDDASGAGLDVFGIGPASDQFQTYFRSDGLAFKLGGGSWSNSSDRRLKKNIAPLSGTLDRVLQLHGYSFEYKPEFVGSKGLAGTQIGLVAQEVEEVFPDWVSIDRDGYRVVTERATTALMVESLRDLRAEKDAQIADLKAENADLKARLDRLEALVTRVQEVKP